MKDKTFQTAYLQLGFDALGSKEQEMVEKSIDFLQHSYSPYSKFKVAAAILMESDDIYAGANFENASYPLCMCAERTAIYHALFASNHAEIKSIAVTTGIQDDAVPPTPPCGACRQVLLEVEERQGKAIAIYLVGTKSNILKFESCKDLLPLAFTPKHLNQK